MSSRKCTNAIIWQQWNIQTGLQMTVPVSDGRILFGEVICTSQWMIDARPMKDWCVKTWSTSALIESPGFPRIMGGKKIPAYEIHPVILSSRNFLITHPTSYFHADSSLMPPSRLSWSDKLCIHRGLGKKSGWKQSSRGKGKQQSEGNW